MRLPRLLWLELKQRYLITRISKARTLSLVLSRIERTEAAHSTNATLPARAEQAHGKLPTVVAQPQLTMLRLGEATRVEEPVTVKAPEVAAGTEVVAAVAEARKEEVAEADEVVVVALSRTRLMEQIQSQQIPNLPKPNPPHQHQVHERTWVWGRHSCSVSEYKSLLLFSDGYWMCIKKGAMAELSKRRLELGAETRAPELWCFDVGGMALRVLPQHVFYSSTEDKKLLS